MVQPVVVDQQALHHDWIVPRRVMCAFFWVGIILLFTGIILLVTSKHKGTVYQSWGCVTLGLGFCLLMICFILCLHAYCVITVSDDDLAKSHQPVHPPNPAALVNGHATRNTTLPRRNPAHNPRPALHNAAQPVQLVIIEKGADKNSPGKEKIVTYIPGEHHIQVEKEATRPTVMTSDTPDAKHNSVAKITRTSGVTGSAKNGHPVRATQDSPEIEITCTPTKLKDDPDVRPKTDYRVPTYSQALALSANETTPLRPSARASGSVRVIQAPGVKSVAYSVQTAPATTGVATRPVYTARVTELPAGGATGSAAPAQPVPVYGRRLGQTEQAASRPPPAPHSQARATPTGTPLIRGPVPRYLGGPSRVFRPIHNPGVGRPPRELLAPESPPGRYNPRAEASEEEGQRSVVFLDPQHGITESKVSIYDNVQYIHV